MADNRTTGLHAFKKDFKYNPIQAIMCLPTLNYKGRLVKRPSFWKQPVTSQTKNNFLTKLNSDSLLSCEKS